VVITTNSLCSLPSSLELCSSCSLSTGVPEAQLLNVLVLPYSCAHKYLAQLVEHISTQQSPSVCFSKRDLPTGSETWRWQLLWFFSKEPAPWPVSVSALADSPSRRAQTQWKAFQRRIITLLNYAQLVAVEMIPLSLRSPSVNLCAHSFSWTLYSWLSSITVPLICLSMLLLLVLLFSFVSDSQAESQEDALTQLLVSSNQLCRVSLTNRFTQMPTRLI